MQSLSGSTPGQTGQWEDLGGPTPENYRSDDDSAKIKTPGASLKQVKDVVNKGAKPAEGVKEEEELDDEDFISEEEDTDADSEELEEDIEDSDEEDLEEDTLYNGKDNQGSNDNSNSYKDSFGSKGRFNK